MPDSEDDAFRTPKVVKRRLSMSSKRTQGKRRKLAAVENNSHKKTIAEFIKCMGNGRKRGVEKSKIDDLVVVDLISSESDSSEPGSSTKIDDKNSTKYGKRLENDWQQGKLGRADSVVEKKLLGKFQGVNNRASSRLDDATEILSNGGLANCAKMEVKKGDGNNSCEVITGIRSKIASILHPRNSTKETDAIMNVGTSLSSTPRAKPPIENVAVKCGQELIQGNNALCPSFESHLGLEGVSKNTVEEMDPFLEPKNSINCNYKGKWDKLGFQGDLKPAGCDGIHKWLHSIGLSKHIKAFEMAEVDMVVLPYLSEEDLEEMGIECEAERTLILSSCTVFCDDQHDIMQDKVCMGDDSNMGQPSINHTNAMSNSWMHNACDSRETQGIDSNSEICSNEEKNQLRKKREVGWRSIIQCNVPKWMDTENGPITGGDSKRKVQATLTQCYGIKTKTPPVPEELTPEPKKKKKKSNWMQNNVPAPPRWTKNGDKWLPEWQRVPGTNFVVDRFRNIWGVDCASWFLTHFHADHYGGLRKSFAQGTIYCSPITARLVNTQIKVPMDRLVEMELRQPKLIEGVKVTFIDANHCPGAVMILFEPPNAHPVLHTGDCRLVESMQNDPLLQNFRKKQTVLVLDTTYCNPSHTFPPQKEVIQNVMDSVKAEAFNEKTLFLFGTYTIGKERVFLEVAKKLGKKVYLGKAKRKIMECLELSKDEKEMLTTDHQETNVHAIPLWKIRLDEMGNILRGYKGKYNTVVGFRPTGWTYEKGMGKRACGKRQQKGKLIVYQVPYSEHSSFNELRGFVEWFDPLRIIPSVGNDRGRKTQSMLTLLKQPKIQTAIENSQRNSQEIK